MTKICSKCRIEKPKTLFSNRKYSKDGLHPHCKLCNSMSNRLYNLTHPKIQQKYSKERYLNYSEKQKKFSKSWNLNNPEKYRAIQSKRRALKLKATPRWYEAEKTAIQELYALANLKTKETGIKHHVDHIVPLNSNIVQGFHCLANLQILEAKANISKGNRIWPDMP